MRRFLIRVFVFVFPFIVIGVIMEVMLRNIPNDYMYKKSQMSVLRNDIEVLFMGSSHSYYSFNPEFFSGVAFNLSHISQQLDLDLLLLEKYAPTIKNLNAVFISIDYFTLYKNHESMEEKWRHKNYNIYYDLNLSHSILGNLEVLGIRLKSNIIRLKKYYLDGKSEITSSPFGYGLKYRKQKDLEESAITASSRHTSLDSRAFPGNVKLLKSFIVSNPKVNVFIITNPAHKFYVKRLDTNQLFTSIRTAQSLDTMYSNCEYVNFLSDSTFKDIHFRDADHLNRDGARILSMKIDSIYSRKAIN